MRLLTEKLESMNGKDLKQGMIVKSAAGTVVQVTHVPDLDKNGECFFSGVLLRAKDFHYRDRIGENFKWNWNSAFFYPE